jgi:hypothetical protein
LTDPGAGPSDGPPAAPGGLPAYDPGAHAEDIVSLQISAFAILALLGAASRRRSLTGSTTARERRAIPAEAGSREAGEVVFTEVESADEGLTFETVALTRRGDRSRTWRWPGTHAVDRLSCRLPPRIAPRSPLLARVVNDAGYLRATLGSASMLLPVLGAVLGALAVSDVNGEALPPAFALAVALAVLGVFDALAGMIGVLVFVVGVVLSGGVSSGDAARTLLGVSTLWFAAPLIAGTARPLRRPPTLTAQEHWDRTADVVIASLIGAWAVQGILLGLPGLSGLDLPIAEKADAAALLVLVALAVRMVVETVAAHWYPARLSQVQPAELGEPGTGQRVAASVLVLAIFVFVAVSYLGSCWQLYVGGALFILPKFLGFFADRLPSSPRAHAVTPRGIVEVVLMLVVGAVVGAIVLDQFTSGREAIRNAFVLLSLPGFALALLELIGRDGPERELPWRHQLLGIPLLALGVLIVLGVVTI